MSYFLILVFGFLYHILLLASGVKIDSFIEFFLLMIVLPTILTGWIVGVIYPPDPFYC